MTYRMKYHTFFNDGILLESVEKVVVHEQVVATAKSYQTAQQQKPTQQHLIVNCDSQQSRATLTLFSPGGGAHLLPPLTWAILYHLETCSKLEIR